MRILPLLALSITSWLGCQNVEAPTPAQTKTPPKGVSQAATRAFSNAEGPHHLFAQFVMNTLTELALYDEAIAYTESVLQQNPKDAYLWTLKAIALTKSSAFDEAAVAFAQAAQRRPTDSEIQLQWGMGRLAAGAPTEAAQHWRQATSLDPKNVSAHLELIRYYRSNERADDASDQSVRAYQANPNDGRVLLEVARSAVDSEGFDAVHARYNRAITAMPTLIDAYTELARYAAKRGEHRIARDAIARGQRALPRYRGWTALKQALKSSVNAPSRANDD